MILDLGLSPLTLDFRPSADPSELPALPDLYCCEAAYIKNRYYGAGNPLVSHKIKGSIIISGLAPFFKNNSKKL